MRYKIHTCLSILIILIFLFLGSGICSAGPYDIDVGDPMEPGDITEVNKANTIKKLPKNVSSKASIVAPTNEFDYWVKNMCPEDDKTNEVLLRLISELIGEEKAKWKILGSGLES